VAEFEVHRSGAAFALGWFTIIVAIGTAVSSALSGGLSADRRVAAVAAAIALGAAGYLFGLRPAVEEEPGRLVVKNLLRDVELPWDAVEDVSVSDVLILVTTVGRIRCYAVPRRAGHRRMSSSIIGFGQHLVERGGYSPPPPSTTDTAAVGDRLRDMVHRLGSRKSDVVAAQTWSRQGVAALVLLAAGLVTAVGLW
jgi:hypothetical protein